MDISLPNPGLVSIKTKTSSAQVVMGQAVDKIAKSEIVLITNTEDESIAAKIKDNAEFLVDSPGEYEYGGLAILGLDSMHSTHDRVSYRLSTNGHNAVFLDNAVVQLDDDSLETLGKVDLLFLVLGEDTVLNPGVATKIVRACDPTYLLPIPNSQSDAKLIQDWLKKDFASNEAIAEKVFKVKPTDTNEIFKVIQLF